MVRETNVMERVLEWENLLKAAKESSKGKRFKAEVLEFNNDLCHNLLALEDELRSGTYTSGRYKERFVYVPQTRLIQVSQFRDRVAQQAIYLVLGDILDKQFIFDSYACRKGKGSLAAAQRVQYWLRQIHRKPDGKNYVCGKLDAAKFFYRLDHKIIMDVLAKYIDDDVLLKVIGSIINCQHTAFGLPEGKTCMEVLPSQRLFDVGVPIGSLMSQTVANMMMNEVDQYAKHVLKIHYYIRYMDDILILAPDLSTVHAWMDALRECMYARIRLRCNKKTAVVPISHGLPFVGKRIWATHMLIRKSTAAHMKKSLKKIAALYHGGVVSYAYACSVIQSYYGMLEHYDAQRLRQWIADNVVLKKPPAREGRDGYAG